MSTCPLTVYPGQIIGVLPSGRIVRAIAGGSEPAGGEGGQQSGTGEQQNAGQQSDQSGSGQSSSSGNAQQSSGGQQQKVAEKVEDLPEWAQKAIKDLRTEAGDNRTAKNAAEQRQQDTLDNIAKALGLKQDEKVDPVKLQEQLASRDAELTQLRREHAAGPVIRKAGGDVDAVLDSRSFARKLGDLDPADTKFDKDLSELVKKTLEDNPKLKAQAQAAGASGGQFAGGPGERRSTELKSLTDAVAASYGTR